MAEDNNTLQLVKVILEGLVRMIKVLKCKITCCKSSCNTNEETETEKYVRI